MCFFLFRGGKRAGSFAIYLEPWHADIESFLELKKNFGDESQRARDLFYALWICDLFMKRIEKDEQWSLFSPDEAPNLNTTFGEEFEKLYCKYEEEKKARKVIQARHLWKQIITAQIELGMPYILFKDSVNRKNAQMNLGTIQSSNLCGKLCFFINVLYCYLQLKFYFIHHQMR
jgi:ribonucleoside-diphosphate reductase alpha chain